MDTSSPFTDLLFYAGIAACLIAAFCILLSTLLRRRSGLPNGEVVYKDTDGRSGELLISDRYQLCGKPDYLIESEEGELIPVEVKSGQAPASGQPYRSHRLQLAVYFLLIEDVLEAEVSHGLIRYRDRNLKVQNSESLRSELLSVLGEMRTAIRMANANRSHNRSQRCAHCSMGEVCDQKLA